MSQSLINLCLFHRSLEVQGNPKKSEENRAEFTCPPILTFLPMTGPVNVNEKKVVEDKVFRNGCNCPRVCLPFQVAGCSHRDSPVSSIPFLCPVIASTSTQSTPSSPPTSQFESGATTHGRERRKERKGGPFGSAEN